MRLAAEKMSFVSFIIISLLLSASHNSIYGQTLRAEEYEKGMSALSKNNIEEAESLFSLSITKNRDADSYYQLGLIKKKKNSYNSRNEALENFQQAALREPGNINYRLGYVRFLEEFAVNSAYNEYKRISSDFHDCTEAYIKLGGIKAREFREFRDSRKIGNEENAAYDFNLSEEAKKDFAEAEQYYSMALRIEPLNENALY